MILHISEKLSQIIEANKKYSKTLENSAELNQYKILFISNVVVHPIEELIVFQLRKLGINLNIQEGLFGNFSSISDGKTKNYDLVIFIFFIEGIFMNYETMDIKNNQKLIDQINQAREEIEISFSMVPNSKKILISSSNIKYFDENNEIRELLSSSQSEWFKSIQSKKIDTIDYETDKNQTTSGLKVQKNKNIFFFTTQDLKNISELISIYTFNYLFPKRKVIFIDGDNTLWEGILADDVNLIFEKSSLDSRVNRHYEFQNRILEYKKNGAVLFLTSKNNEADVLNFFNVNPHMPITLKDFVEIKVNWQNKSNNIQNALSKINLSPDSAIFIDDSNFEIAEVHSVLPDVLCIRAEFDDPAYRFMIKKLDILCSNLIVTKEDFDKTAMYQVENQRQEFSKKFQTHYDFLESLETSIKIKQIESEEEFTRAVQLSNKTNQFNLRQLRYDYNNLCSLIANKKLKGFLAKVKDRFGDLGYVGFITLTEVKFDKSIFIEEFALSCRAFGRDIAEVFLARILKEYKNLGFIKAFATFSLSQKNSRFKDFYLHQGFEIENETSNYTIYKIDLLRWNEPKIHSFQKIDLQI